MVELVVAEARVRDWYGVHGGHRRRAQVQRRQQRRGEEVAVEGAQKFLPRFHVVLDETAQSGQVVQLVHCERWDGDGDRDGEVSAGMRASGSTDGTRWTGRGRKDEWPPRRSFGNLNLSVRTRTSPRGGSRSWRARRVRTRSASRSRIAAIRRGEWGRDRAREPRRDADARVDPGASRSGEAMRAGVDFRAKRRGGRVARRRAVAYRR